MWTLPAVLVRLTQGATWTNGGVEAAAQGRCEQGGAGATTARGNESQPKMDRRNLHMGTWTHVSNRLYHCTH